MVKKCLSVFPKAVENILKCLVVSKTQKNTQFPLIEDERNLFSKLESKHFDFVFL